MLSRILLVGCGEKQVKRVNQCIAIDLNSDCIKKSKIISPQNEYILADAKYLPFKKEYFDKVVCTEVIEHVESPKEVLNEMLRVLSKGGRLYMSIPLNFSCKELANKLPAYRRDFYEGYHKTKFDIEKIRELVKDLKIKQCQKIGKKSYVFWRIWAKVIKVFNLDVKIKETGRIVLKSNSLLKQGLFNILSKAIKIISILIQNIFGKCTTIKLEIEK